jgi:hypothetical protein
MSGGVNYEKLFEAIELEARYQIYRLAEQARPLPRLGWARDRIDYLHLERSENNRHGSPR